jgi:nicotinamide mononucleotide transporter
LQHLIQSFLSEVRNTSWPEFVAVVFGIASVIFSRRENILVYPVGMVNTGIFIYLYLIHKLYADALVNLYYTILSITGWIMWARKKEGRKVLSISRSSSREWRLALGFFASCWILLYLLLHRFTDSTVPIADSFTAAAAFTGMWLMNRKKLENWTWWIITNLASIPLNFYKQLVFASFQYLVFLILAILGYLTWNKKITAHAA